MNNFTFNNPTKIIFGKGTILKLGKEIPVSQKILLTFGGGSIKQNGVYEQVKETLKNHTCVEFWGIEPNPKVSTLRKAIALGQQEKVDFIVAIGGGSVLDGTKLIASGILSKTDAWELVLDNSKITEIIPFASVLTLPATGSEMNAGAVISNLATQEKYAFEATFPQFSILDPETTFSLPLFQIACGIADTYVHVMEQYLVDANHSPLMDRWAEGILQTLIEIAPAVRQNSQNYEQMSHFMLSATLALNGFISMGTRSDWATHMIGHELTAFTGLTHGETLAIIEPALMRVMKNKKRKKLLQYAQRVWNISNMDEEQTINLVIDKTEAFYRSLPLRTRLSECNVEEDTINQIIQRFQSRGDCLGENRDIDYKIVKQILDVCSH